MLITTFGLSVLFGVGRTNIIRPVLFFIKISILASNQSVACFQGRPCPRPHTRMFCFHVRFWRLWNRTKRTKTVKNRYRCTGLRHGVTQNANDGLCDSNRVKFLKLPTGNVVVFNTSRGCCYVVEGNTPPGQAIPLSLARYVVLPVLAAGKRALGNYFRRCFPFETAAEGHHK